MILTNVFIGGKHNCGTLLQRFDNTGSDADLLCSRPKTLDIHDARYVLLQRLSTLLSLQIKNWKQFLAQNDIDIFKFSAVKKGKEP